MRSNTCVRAKSFPIRAAAFQVDCIHEVSHLPVRSSIGKKQLEYFSFKYPTKAVARSHRSGFSTLNSPFSPCRPRIINVNPAPTAPKNPEVLTFVQPVLLNLYNWHKPSNSGLIRDSNPSVSLSGGPLAIFRALICILASDVSYSWRTSSFQCSGANSSDTPEKAFAWASSACSWRYMTAAPIVEVRREKNIIETTWKSLVPAKSIPDQ